MFTHRSPLCNYLISPDRLDIMIEPVIHTDADVCTARPVRGVNAVLKRKLAVANSGTTPT